VLDVRPERCSNGIIELSQNQKRGIQCEPKPKPQYYPDADTKASAFAKGVAGDSFASIGQIGFT
jgi:hypothetical protein